MGTPRTASLILGLERPGRTPRHHGAAEGPAYGAFSPGTRPRGFKSVSSSCGLQDGCDGNNRPGHGSVHQPMRAAAVRAR